MARSYIRDFALSNPAYINAQVAFYTVDGSGNRTETYATLYAGSTGSAQVENPQRLGSLGMLQNPVYHEDPVIAVVISEGQPSHETGIIRNVEADADRAEAAADSIETAYASFGEIETARDDAAASASAAASSLSAAGLPSPAVADTFLVRNSANDEYEAKTATEVVTILGVEETDINEQTGTTYSPVIGDANDLVTLTNASAISLTIPANSSVAYPIGTTIAFQQGGAGLVTMSAAGGVTLNSRNGLVSGGQFAMWSITKTATDVWAVTGDLTS